jgi:hypothetical protein
VSVSLVVIPLRSGGGGGRGSSGSHAARTPRGENEVGPQFGEQDTVDVGEQVGRGAFTEDDLVEAGALSAVAQVEGAVGLGQFQVQGQGDGRECVGRVEAGRWDGTSTVRPRPVGWSVKVIVGMAASS